jgi:phosphohistidine phosphatase
MRDLRVMRHAEARQAAGVRDHDRPLSERGTRDAARAGASLSGEPGAPGIILGSTALRAAATARAVADACGCRVALLDELYLASPQACLEALAVHGEGHASVLLVGHNPGLEDLVAMLARTRVALPPAGFVRLSLAIDAWIDLLAPRRACGAARVVGAPALGR